MSKILLIEDDILLAEMYELLFKARGYEIAVLNDGVSGIEEAKKNQPDLILLDMMMPKMNGLEVLDILKSMPETKELPVLMLSNLNDEHYTQEAMKAGAAGYIDKSGNDASQLINRVETVIHA